MSSFQGMKINPQKFDKSQLKFLLYLVPLAVFMALPIVFIFNQALKPLDELFAFPPTFFVRRPTLENFVQLFQVTSTSGIPISRYLFNSVLATMLVVIFSVVFSSLAGFALSKLNFKFKNFLFEINTIALMFIGTAVTIPKYILIEKLGLIDTFWVNILPLLAIPVGLFLVKQFIDQIPDSLLEAARMDGANDFMIYRKIIMPLIMPALATVAILSFQAVWNNTETSTLYINRDSLRTFAFYMSTLTSSTGTSVAGVGMQAAASLIMFIPNLVIFVVMQSRVMNTMAHSGIK